MNMGPMPGGPQLYAFVRSIPPASASPYAPGFDYIDAVGAFLRVTEANLGFTVNIDGQGDIPWGIAHEYACPEGEWFRRVKVINTSTTETLTVTILVGRGAIKDDRLAIVRERPQSIMPVVEQDSDPIAWTGTSILAGTGVSFPGTPPSGYMKRRSITVTNRDAANPLELRDAAGNVFGVVFKESSQVWYASGPVTVHNATGVAIAASIGEVWYRNQPA